MNDERIYKYVLAEDGSTEMHQVFHVWDEVDR